MTECKEALASARRLSICYNGTCRTVEVHAVGISKSGNAIMRAWQLENGEPAGWKLFSVDKITQIATLEDQTSEAPRPGYKPNDSAMAEIVCQI